MEKQIDKESISKRDIILNESFRLFLKKGYAAVSFADLVEATNVSRGNMFHHFKNKEDIFHHAVDRFVFQFLTNDAPDLLAFTSSMPLKDFIDNRIENIGRRMKSFFMMTKGTVTPANFMSFILYLKDNYPDWKEKFQEYENRKNLEWKEVIELAKQKGEITQTVETENIILLLSGKTFWGLSVLVKIDLNLLFLSIIGYYRSFLVKIKCLQFETENQAPG